MEKEILQAFGLEGKVQWGSGDVIDVISPINNKVIGKVACTDKNNYEASATRAVSVFHEWRQIPAPKRGEIVRQIGEEFRVHKKELGALISLEMGKILSEGEGEVQEVIDMADFAVGQSRMLYGMTTHSERPDHRMYEQWHPLGPVGVISAFNFPVAVWAWNAMLALICGNPVIWKPSSKTPLTAIASTRIAWNVLLRNNLPCGLLQLVIGDRKNVGQELVDDRRIPLISATGSVAMGRNINKSVAARLGKTILELGGNNAIIISAKADLNMAVRAVLFGAVGTAGQRCTTTRRVIIHNKIHKDFISRLIKAYEQIKIGSPLDESTMMGPLIDKKAVRTMQRVITELKADKNKILYGGEVLKGGIYDAGTYVEPCICEVGPHVKIVKQETFAPLLYVMKYDELKEAIRIQNDVPQGLSSAIFTNDMREAETFLSYMGSDCGIANVNIGTSGAEIGGAFGGEKETGGGREAGSDAWKSYMRRQTNTINWSTELPLAQGIQFG